MNILGTKVNKFERSIIINYQNYQFKKTHIEIYLGVG